MSLAYTIVAKIIDIPIIFLFIIMVDRNIRTVEFTSDMSSSMLESDADGDGRE